MQENPAAYEGAAPYVFASYCHDDAPRVLPVLRGLVDAGVNVWYDEGIHAGDEWPEVIAEHLLKASVFLAFFSCASQDSHNCRREFNLAVQEDKPVVAVSLEEFAATPALKMQLVGAETIDSEGYDSLGGLQDDVVKAVRDKMPASSEPEVQVPAACGKDEGGDSGDARNDLEDVGHGAEIAGHGAEASKRVKQSMAGKVVAAAVVVLAVFCIALFASSGPDEWAEDVDEEGAIGSYALSTASPALSAEDGIEVILVPKRGSSISDFSSAIARVKDRLDIFAGTGAYDLRVQDGKALALLPRAAFEGLGVEEALDCYIVRNIMLYFCSEESPKKKASIGLARRNIEEAAVVDWPSADSVVGGYPEGVSPLSKVVKITLSSTFMKSRGDKLGEWGDKLVLMQDIGNDGPYHWNVLRDVDGRSFYLYGVKELQPEVLQTVVYNYLHAPLDGTFSYIVNWNHEISWEDPATCRLPGENQVAFSALNGQVMQLRYQGESSLSAGKVLDWKRALKKRIDTLGIPYALGSFTSVEASNREGANVVLAMQNQGIDSCIPYLLESRSWADLCADGRILEMSMLSPYGGSVALTSNDDGALRAVVSSGKMMASYRKQTGDFFAALEPGDCVTYEFDGVKVFRASYAGKQDGGYVLHEITTPSGISADEEGGSWLTPMFGALAETENRVPWNVEYKGFWITEDDHLLLDQESAMLRDAFVVQVEEAARKASPGAKAWVDDDVVFVALGLRVAEGFPQQAMDASRAVFEAVGTDLKGYTGVCLVLAPEKDAKEERARMGMYMDLDQDTGEYQVYYWLYMANGRMKPYTQEFKEILANDGYWASKTVKADYAY